MKGFGWVWTGLAFVSGGALLFGAAHAQHASAQTANAQSAKALPALSLLQPGLWQVRQLKSRQPVAHSLCIGDPAFLMQVEHGQAPCTRLVLTTGPRGATVHYTCPANGFGRTTVRVETPRLATIDTQGIIGGAPFAYRAEARHVGSCPEQATAGR